MSLAADPFHPPIIGIRTSPLPPKTSALGVPVVSVRCVYFSATCVVQMVARSKVWVCGRSHAGIVGSNLAGGMDVCLL
jgi:hypothetical protein